MGVDTGSPQFVGRITEILDAATAVDGIAPLGEQAVKGVGRPGVTEVTVTEAADIVGYANVTPARDDEPAMIELVVDPDHRRRGHGKRLLAETLARVTGDVRVWAHGDLPAAKALASASGLTARRQLLQLRRPLPNPALPELAVPDDLVLRTYAGTSDDSEILRVNNVAFAWHPEQGGWGQQQIDERTGSDWFDPAGLFLAFEASAPDRLLGFHWTKVHSPALGEVYIVGVDTAAQGRGLGRLLTLAGVHYLADRGIDEVELYVEGDNAAALNTYGKLGFEQYAIDVAYG